MIPTHLGPLSSDPHILIAGHGYLGEAIARQAEDMGWRVTSIARRSSRRVYRCDITDTTELRALPAVPTHLVHCASSGKSGDMQRYRELYLAGIKNLCHAFPSARPCFVSSTSVYGQKDGSLVTEDSETQPPKASGEVLLEAEEVALEFGGIATRLAGIYGPRRAISIKRFLAGEASIEEDGSRITNHIHRDDAAAAILHLLATEKNDVFNVADDAPLSQKDLYSSFSQTFDLPLPPSVDRKLGTSRGWSNKAVSNAKLRGTGWQPSFPDIREAAAKIAQTLT